MHKDWRTLFVAMLDSNMDNLDTLEGAEQLITSATPVDHTSAHDSIRKIVKEVRRKLKDDEPLTYADHAYLCMMTNICLAVLKQRQVNLTKTIDYYETAVTPAFDEFRDSDDVESAMEYINDYFSHDLAWAQSDEE